MKPKFWNWATTILVVDFVALLLAVVLEMKDANEADPQGDVESIRAAVEAAEKHDPNRPFDVNSFEDPSWEGTSFEGTSFSISGESDTFVLATFIVEPNEPDNWTMNVVDANRIDDDTIRRLCVAGRVCEVMGHQGQYAPGIPPGHVVYRETCGLCGACRSQ